MTTLATPPDRPPFDPADIATDEDGVCFSLSTGEVLDPADMERLGITPSPAQCWAITNRPDAESALEYRSKLEASLEALHARKAALVKNLDAQIRQQERRLCWWDWRYRSPLLSLARALMTGRSKTVQFDYGKVSFRQVPEKPYLIDEEAALEWAETYVPDIVKRKEWVTPTDVAQAAKVGGVTLCLKDFLGVTPAHESVSIKTGVARD